MIGVGIIGLGYWGPNLVRNFNTNSKFNVECVCDLDDKQLQKNRQMYPHIETTKQYTTLLDNPKIQAICICTPVHTHYKFSKLALESGKHVLVEKPMTSNSDQAKQLIVIAENNNLVLMCDHTFCYHSIPKYIKSEIRAGAYGEFLYLDSTRVNLGLFQSDINVIWDLIPHDLSIIGYLFQDFKISSVSAHAFDLVGTGKESIAYIVLRFDNGKVAHIHLNWLSPVKIRQYIIGFSKKMIVWDDNKVDEKIKIYDKGIQIDETKKNSLLVSYHNDGFSVPKIECNEALAGLVQDFWNSIANGSVPVSNAQFSLQIVEIMEAITESFKNGGKIVNV